MDRGAWCTAVHRVVELYPAYIQNNNNIVLENNIFNLYLLISLNARTSNQSILKKMNYEYSVEGLMLKLQYFCHLMRRGKSLEKTLMLGIIEGGTRRGHK